MANNEPARVKIAFREWVQGHETAIFAVVSFTSAALAAASLAAAYCYARQEPPPLHLLFRAKLIVAFWVIGPPCWLWFEWFYIVKPKKPGQTDFDQYAHGQSVVRAMWLALVTLLIGAFGLLPGS